MADTKSNNPVPNFYRASAEDFKKIPGSPIAYWTSTSVWDIFGNEKLGEIAFPRKGLDTGDNEKFLRLWIEVNYLNIEYRCSGPDFSSKCKWYPINRGGNYRKWYGNNEFLINWFNDGEEIKSLKNIDGKTKANLRNESYYFKESITWSAISSSNFSSRYCPPGGLFGAGGYSVFSDFLDIYIIGGLLGSKISNYILKIISPTLNFEAGNISAIPFINPNNDKTGKNVRKLIDLSKNDWDSYETSWDFTTLPLISPEYLSPTIEASYQKLRSHWQEMTTEMKELEEENNKIFIEAYGLQDELTPDVPLSEITLTCNPHYRYDASKPEEELEALLRTDTIKELISYAVGCMFGRYSLDKPGLILANQGETVEDYLKQVPHPTFRPDDDNIIPVLDDEYFPDDIVGRFKNFLKIVFGEKTLSQNLDYIAQALTGKSTPSPEKVIRDYFLKDFFKDHVQRYKKRPIYWMFSSGKQQGFNALIYMHRYNKTTLAKMRTDYLLELEAKLDAELTALSEDPVKNKARISKIKKQIDEMKTWDELLNNKALALIEIDLDDGVVVNYAKFKGLVRAI